MSDTLFLEDPRILGHSSQATVVSEQDRWECRPITRLRTLPPLSRFGERLNEHVEACRGRLLRLRWMFSYPNAMLGDGKWKIEIILKQAVGDNLKISPNIDATDALIKFDLQSCLCYGNAQNTRLTRDFTVSQLQSGPAPARSIVHSTSCTHCLTVWKRTLHHICHRP